MQKVKLNIVPKGVKKTTFLSQNDNGRVVRYELFNELIPYILDGSETITLKVVRPDGEEILANIENTFEGEAYIDVSFNDDMSAITGVGAGEIKITDGETELGSHNFDINVEIDAYNGKDVVIETETGTLLSFNTEVEDNALEYESEIPYNAAGYTGLRVVNTRTAPVYDKTPYLFRKTPSGYGNSCIEKLNGLSVAFNQKILNGNFENTNNWNINGLTTVFSVSNNEATLEVDSAAGGIYQSNNFIVGHKYLWSIDVINGGKIQVGSGAFGLDRWRIDDTSSSYRRFARVDVATLASAVFVVYSNEALSQTIKAKNYICIDLTQMFGSTIADYIYSLETAQAGAGVSYFKNLFGADYYPYNAGELMSVKTSGRKTIGFNQWSEEWEQGSINFNTGIKQNDNTKIRTKNFNRCLPETQYCFRKPIGMFARLCFYDINQNFISSPDVIYTQSLISIFTTPSNACYFMFILAATSYNNNVCVNLHLDGSRDGEYEPYNSVTYPLDPDLELRGIAKLDANNKLYADGDIYESSGAVTRRYGIVTLNGSESWTWDSNNNLAYTPVSDAIKVDPVSQLRVTTKNSSGRFIDKSWGGRSTDSIGSYYGQPRLFIKSDSFTSVADVTNYLLSNPITVIYEKETPASESADPFTDPQEARITEEFIDTREIPIPVAQDSVYGTDIEYQDIDFNTTIYGGDIDAVNGVLSSEYNSDGSVKPTPEIIDITPTPIPVKAGDNKIFNNANGNQTIRYYNQVEE